MLARLEIRLTTEDRNRPINLVEKDLRFSAEILKQETVTLTLSSFTALSPPSGSKFVLIDPGAAISLVLKGVSGDTGTTLTPATLPPRIPIVLPLGATPSIGILNNRAADQAVEITWLYDAVTLVEG